MSKPIGFIRASELAAMDEDERANVLACAVADEAASPPKCAPTPAWTRDRDVPGLTRIQVLEIENFLHSEGIDAFVVDCKDGQRARIVHLKGACFLCKNADGSPHHHSSNRWSIAQAPGYDSSRWTCLATMKSITHWRRFAF